MEKQNETAEGNAAQKKQQMQEQQPRCLFCGQPEQLIWVHGRKRQQVAQMLLIASQAKKLIL